MYAFLLLLSLAGSTVLSAEQRSKTYSFRSQRTVGTIDQVKSTLEVRGDLIVTEEGKLTRLKTGVAAHLDYHERFLAADKSTATLARSVRYYDDASADIKVDKDDFQPTLDNDRRLIAVEAGTKSATLFSPNGPLTREELDLIDLQGNTLLLDRLLPEKPVAVEDQWNLSDDLVTALLRLDEVGESDVVAKLASVADGSAIVELSGKVKGAINGVSTEIELKGKYRFNMPAGRIDWAAFLIRENRSIGHVGTGLDVVARLQAIITPDKACDQLTEAALQDLPLESNPGLTALICKSGDGQWHFTYDRRWFVTGAEKDHIVLRMVDRGELVAQSNIASLAQVAPEKLITLSGFQEDIQRALGKNFGQFIKASQEANDADYRVYRVAAEGEVEGLPIEWIYHLVADRHGHQVSFAFTVEKGLSEQFAQADEPLVQALRFVEPSVARNPKSEDADRQ